MSDLHSLAILVGLGKEYEEGLAPLQEAELKIKGVLKAYQGFLGSIPLVGGEDPDAEFYAKYKWYIDRMIDLEDALELISKFTKGVLKYE